MSLFALRPRARIEFGPVVPTFLWWKRGEMAAARARVEGFFYRVIFNHGLDGFCLSERHGLGRLDVSVLEEHESDQCERRAPDSDLCADNSEHGEQRQEPAYY